MRVSQINSAGFPTAEVAVSGTAIDWSTGSSFRKTINSDTTFSFTLPTAGQKIILLLYNSSGGSVTPTFPTTVRWDNNASGPGSIATVTATLYMFHRVSTTYYGQVLADYMDSGEPVPGADGAYNSSGSENFGSTTDGPAISKYFTTFTLNSGHTLSVSNRCKGLIINCTGNATINGTLTMSAKGANAAGAALSYQGVSVPAAGAAGGAAKTAGPYGGNATGNPGSAGSSGGTGGGGSGGAVTDGGSGAPATSGAGGTGTSYSGGPGGGGCGSQAGYGAKTSSPGAANGGAGGNVDVSDNTGAGGGAGNPGGTGIRGDNGQTGTGGLIVLITDGNLTIGAAGIVSANGTNGGAGISGPNGAAGGGGSGGGRVILLYHGTLSNSGTTQANGGTGGSSPGGTRNGGAGGAGSVTIQSF